MVHCRSFNQPRRPLEGPIAAYNQVMGVLAPTRVPAVTPTGDGAPATRRATPLTFLAKVWRYRSFGKRDTADI